MRQFRFQDQLRLAKRRQRLHKLGLMAGAFFLLAGLAVYLLFFAKLFNVQSVEVSGVAGEAQTEIESAVSVWLDGRSLWLTHRSNSLIFSPQQLSAQLISSLPRIESLEVLRESFHKLTIKIIERQPIGIWCLTQKNQCYYFDKTATAYQLAGTSEGFILTTVMDQRVRELALGSAVTDKNLFDSIFIAKMTLQKYDLIVANFLIPENSPRQLNAVVMDGVPNGPVNWQIYLNTATNIPSQITALANLLKNQLTKEQRGKLQYVDLRIENRIYWR